MAKTTQATGGDAAEALAFLADVFGDLPDAARWFHLWEKSSRLTLWSDNPDAAAKWAVRNARRGDVYAGIGLSDFQGSPTNRIQADTATGIVGLLSDVDILGPGHDAAKRYPPSLGAAIELVEKFPLPPTYLILSGGGLHLWWLLKEPWIFRDSGERFAAQDLSRRWSQALQAVANGSGFDLDSRHDLASILRIPGTYNHKLLEPRPVTVLQVSADRRYNPEDFEQFADDDTDDAGGFDAAEAQAAAALRAGDLGLPDGEAAALRVRFDELRAQDTRLAATWDRTREDLKDRSPSGYDLALADRLACDHRWAAAEVAWALGHSRASHQGDRPLHPAKLEKTVAKALARAAKGGKRQERPTAEPQEPVRATEEVGLGVGGGMDLLRARELVGFNESNAGDGELIAHVYGHRLRYDWQRERWLRFGEHLWENAPGAVLTHMGKQAARARYGAACELQDDRARKWAFGGESKQRVEAALYFAKATAPIADAGEGWDEAPMMLGCPNGVVDLGTGELRAGSPGDKITACAAVPYDPAAECPRWLRFLQEVFGDDDDMIAFVWRAVGYSITGRMDAQVFFMAHGKGSNGKSVFANVLRNLLGDYGADSPFATWELQQRTAIPADLAALAGRRFVTSAETSESARLNEARLKAWTGGDPITCRFLRENFFTYSPTGKLWLCVNHRPRVTDDSEGFWRRVRLVPFERQFLADACDEKLPEKLRAEAAGILRWAVQGACLWAAEGLPAPTRVLAAGAEWRQDADPLGDWLACCCVTEPQAWCMASGLYASYTAWAKEAGWRDRDLLSVQAWGRRMGDRFTKKRSAQGILYCGVRLAGASEMLHFEAFPN